MLRPRVVLGYKMVADVRRGPERGRGDERAGACVRRPGSPASQYNVQTTESPIYELLNKQVLHGTPEDHKVRAQQGGSPGM